MNVADFKKLWLINVYYAKPCHTKCVGYNFEANGKPTTVFNKIFWRFWSKEKKFPLINTSPPIHIPLWMWKATQTKLANEESVYSEDRVISTNGVMPNYYHVFNINPHAMIYSGTCQETALNYFFLGHH